MNLSRKISLTLLLMTISVPVIFCYYFSIQQQIVKQHMYEALEQKELQTLVIPTEEIEWFEKGKELLINGALFDVKEYHFENGVLIAKGLYDAKETELKASLERSMNDSPFDAGSSKIISKLLSQVFSDHNHLLIDTSGVLSHIKTSYPTYSYKLANSDISLPHPPPKA